MKIVPFKNLLCKPLELQTGNFYPERIVDRAIEKYEKQFESLQKENEELRKQLTWIPVEKELPNETGRYLVYDPNSPLMDKEEVMRFDTYNNQWFIGSDVFHPSHWLPIPEITTIPGK